MKWKPAFSEDGTPWQTLLINPKHLVAIAEHGGESEFCSLVYVVGNPTPFYVKESPDAIDEIYHICKNKERQ